MADYIAAMLCFAPPPFIIDSAFVEETKKEKGMSGLRFSDAICVLAINRVSPEISICGNYLLKHE